MNPKVIGVGILVLAIIGVAAMQLSKSSMNSQTADQSVSPTVVATTAPVEATGEEMTTSSYEDGEYEAVGNYTSPAGEEEVEIMITLEGGVVTAAEFTGKATHNVSMKLQKSFSEGFEEQVVGKSIDEIALTVVNGSSLTPKGFMDALQKVKTEATQS